MFWRRIKAIHTMVGLNSAASKEGARDGERERKRSFYAPNYIEYISRNVRCCVAIVRSVDNENSQ